MEFHFHFQRIYFIITLAMLIAHKFSFLLSFYPRLLPYTHIQYVGVGERARLSPNICFSSVFLLWYYNMNQSQVRVRTLYVSSSVLRLHMYVSIYICELVCRCVCVYTRKQQVGQQVRHRAHTHYKGFFLFLSNISSIGI